MHPKGKDSVTMTRPFESTKYDLGRVATFSK